MRQNTKQIISTSKSGTRRGSSSSKRRRRRTKAAAKTRSAATTTSNALLKMISSAPAILMMILSHNFWCCCAQEEDPQQQQAPNNNPPPYNLHPHPETQKKYYPQQQQQQQSSSSSSSSLQSQKRKLAQLTENAYYSYGLAESHLATSSSSSYYPSTATTATNTSSGGIGGVGTTTTASTTASADSSSSSSSSLLVTIPSLGKVQGRRSVSVDFYGGIPYAAPPVGQLRFAPPEPPPPWAPVVLDASHYGPDCWQLIDPIMNPGVRKDYMNEDCLTLNIVTPAGHAKRVKSGGRDGSSGSGNVVGNFFADKKNKGQQQHSSSNNDRLLPVLVWLHGGAFQQGGARRPEYDGHRLAERDVIVVTINYRLGALGFLVSSTDGIMGNFGLMDQRAALHFIHDNIIYFGGDPNRVTLFGESAGALMTGQHLMMEGVGTLFHSAIMQSNPLGYQFRSVVIADYIGEALKRSVDCRDLDCLRAERVEEIMRAQSSLMGIPRSVGDFFTWAPTLTQQERNINHASGGSSTSNPALLVDYDDIQHQRRRRNKGKRARELYSVNVTQPLKNAHLIPDNIPIIIGSNQHEGEMFIHSAFPITMSKPVYWMFVGALFRDSASRVLKHYRGYVEQIEADANELAKKQVEEEENKLYYLEHQQQLEKEYEMLLAMSSSSSRSSSKAVMKDYEGLEALVNTWSTGGSQDPNDDFVNGTKKPSNAPWYSNLLRDWTGQNDQETAESKETPRTTYGKLTEQSPKGESSAIIKRRRKGPLERVRSFASSARKRIPFLKEEDPQVVAERAAERELKRQAKAKARALKEAAKVVVDYRPVMSRIINDYLFRCPSWHYAHDVSRNRIRNSLEREDLNYNDPPPGAAATTSEEADESRSTNKRGQKKKKSTKHNNKRKRSRNNNNVYVYRFSQPTHIPGYDECWGKSCHTSELPYVFQAMSIIRSHYSTLSPFAEAEAPVEPEYPYTDILAAYQGALEEMEYEDLEEDPIWKDSRVGGTDGHDKSGEETGTDDFLDGPSSSTGSSTINRSPLSNHTASSSSAGLGIKTPQPPQQQGNFNIPESKAFQSLLKSMFGDYFVDDADEEMAADMAERWVSFAKKGDPNYDGSKANWLPWRYQPTQVGEDADAEDIPWQPQEFEYMDDELEDEDEDEDDLNRSGGFQWSEDRAERIYRKRALKALGMEVTEQDVYRTELRRVPAASDFSEMEAVFTFLFGNAASDSRRRRQRRAAAGNNDDDVKKMSKHAIRQVQQIAQAMGVVGTGLRGEPTRNSDPRWDDDFFPEMMEFKWPPEGRLVERDCTCDLWDRIRYRY